MTDAESIEPDQTQSLDTRLVEVLEQYMADRRAGNAPEHVDLIAANPDLAQELKSCLEGIDLLGDDPVLQPLVRRGVVGDFRIGREIGRGGMGIVYEAYQKSLDRTVALKILNLPINDGKVMERFQREAAMAARLQHDGIVPIYEVGSETGTHFYAMRLIDGHSLAELVAKKPSTLDVDQVARWGLQAAEALAHAHERGVIHRDIKPSNLIVDPDQKVWLTDFGLARRMDDVRMSVTGAVLGTPRYMSPEQASTISAPVDERTDIYSLGATLYELACGQPAVAGDHPVAVIQKIMSDDRTSPRQHRPEISRDLETILMRCLEKHPSDRYPNATSLAGDLRALVEGRPIASRPTSWVENSRRWLNRNQLLMRWAAFGGLAAAILLFLTLWLRFVYPTLDDANLEMSTHGAGLRADLIRLDGPSAPVSASVPTTTPITIDAGQWIARLIQPGAFSQDVRHWLEPGEDRGILLPSPPQALWEMDDVITSHPIMSSDGDELLIVTPDTIEQRDARTGQVRWSRKRTELNLTYGNGGVLHSSNWAIFPEAPESCFKAKPICVVGELESQIADLNGDGHPDILLASFDHPAILALSGFDGEQLWAINYAAELGVHPTVNGIRCLSIEAGQDGELIAIFATNRFGQPRFWLTRIDAVDGSIDWKVEQLYGNVLRKDPVAAMMVPTQRPTDQARHAWLQSQGYTFIQVPDHHRSWTHNATMAPLNREVGKTIYCASDNELLTIDRIAGGPLKTQATFEGPPVMPPELVRAGQNHRFLVATQAASTQQLRDVERLTLTCYSETLQDVVWKRTVRASPDASAGRWSGRPRLPMVIDLNGDGRDEIITQVDRKDLPDGRYSHDVVWTDMQILDCDGKETLKEPVRLPNADLQLLHVQVVDDRDNDGWDDLAIATRYLAMRDTHGGVYVELISSQSGDVIWRKKLESQKTGRQRGVPEVHQFRREVFDDQERLIIELVGNSGFGAPHRSVLLNPDDGSVTHVGEQLSVRSILSRTDSPILWCVNWAKENRDDRTSTRSYRAFQLPSDAVMQVSQNAQPIADLDGDGKTDLQVHRVTRGSTDQPSVVSTATGNLIPSPFSDPTAQNQFQLLSFDLTGNGKNDFLAWRHDQSVRLFEGGTGRECWALSENLFLQQNPLGTIPASLSSDNGRDMILITYAEMEATPTFGLAPWKMPLWVVGVRGGDGEVLWKQDFGLVASTGGYDQLHYAAGDLNQDSRTDVVFSYFNDAQNSSMFAVGGQTGKRLWELPDVYVKSTNWLNRFPQPVIIHAGDRKRVAFLGPETGVRQDYRLVIADTKGQALDAETIISRHANWTYHVREKRWGRHQLVPLRSADDLHAHFAFWVINDERKFELHTRRLTADSSAPVHAPWTLSGDDGDLPNWKNWMRVMAADADGDGNDELIFCKDGFVAAYQQDGTELWQHPLPGELVTLETIRTVGEVTECICMVENNDRYSVHAVDVRDGSPRWTMRGRPFMIPIGDELARGMIDDLPLPTFVLSDRQRHIWMTATAEPAGDVSIANPITAAEPMENRASPLADEVDVRLLGPGPYAGPLNFAGVPRRFAGRIAWSVIWAIFVILLPAYLLVRVAIRRQFSLGMMMAATAAVSICFAVLTVPVGNQLVNGVQRFWMGFAVVPFFLWAGLAIAFYRRGLRSASVCVLCAPILIVIGYECFNWMVSSPTRVAVPSDLLRLWRGMFVTIPITVVLGGPIWVALWFQRSSFKTTSKAGLTP